MWLFHCAILKFQCSNQEVMTAPYSWPPQYSPYRSNYTLCHTAFSTVNSTQPAINCQFEFLEYIWETRVKNKRAIQSVAQLIVLSIQLNVSKRYPQSLGLTCSLFASHHLVISDHHLVVESYDFSKEPTKFFMEYFLFCNGNIVGQNWNWIIVEIFILVIRQIDQKELSNNIFCNPLHTPYWSHVLPRDSQ